MVDQLVYQTAFPKKDNVVLGIAFSSMTRDNILWRLLYDHIPDGEGVRLLVTANVDHISNLVRKARFRSAYAGAWAATADGMPVYLYAKLRGSAAPELITGADLSSQLLNRISSDTCRPFFVVGQEETGLRLQQVLAARGFSEESVAFVCPKFGFENDAAASAALAKAIREHGTTHLFFGLGAPKSEIWIHENRKELGDTYALAIGASLDFYVGLRQRAPLWMRRYGLEWAWRVMSEPRRLFRRYFVESGYALWAVVLDLFGPNISLNVFEADQDKKSV
jgi:N-acetylglucosaminyldiphosphoundecaprenol N-acetyl-beta-D-mannosaminyltransferase